MTTSDWRDHNDGQPDDDFEPTPYFMPGTPEYERAQADREDHVQLAEDA